MEATLAYNGAGLFARLYNFVSDRNAAIKIRADRMDAEMDGFATGLSNCITKDGQTTVTQDIPFNGKKITGLGDATAASDALNRQTGDARYRAVGQCRLAKSGANLVLSRFNGTILVINGNAETIPSAGVSLAATSLTPGTTYYIYAYMSGTTMTLDASTTGKATDTATGVEIKSGDATRTLVGLWDCITGPAWAADDGTRIGGVSWFNRLQKTAIKKFTANRTVASGGSAAEVNSEIRVTFVAWPDEEVTAEAVGGWTVTGAASGFADIRFDGIAAAIPRQAAHSATSTGSLSARNDQAVTIGSHYATIFAVATGGTNVLFAGGTNGDVSLAVHVRG